MATIAADSGCNVQGVSRKIVNGSEKVNAANIAPDASEGQLAGSAK